MAKNKRPYHHKKRNIGLEMYLLGQKDAYSDDQIAHMLAGLALTLKDKGFENDAIEDVIADTYKIFMKGYEEHINIIALCNEMTGINVLPEKYREVVEE